jgi:hypothetical protein
MWAIRHERLARVETGARERLELGTSGNTTKMAMPRTLRGMSVSLV